MFPNSWEIMIILRLLSIILQTHYLNYDMIIGNHKHYLWYEIHHFKNSKYYLQKHFEIIKLMLLFQILKLIAQIYNKYLSKPIISTNNKSPWGITKPMAMCVHFVGPNML